MLPEAVLIEHYRSLDFTKKTFKKELMTLSMLTDPTLRHRGLDELRSLIYFLKGHDRLLWCYLSTRKFIHTLIFQKNTGKW
jgi:hypothetical protein